MDVTDVTDYTTEDNVTDSTEFVTSTTTEQITTAELTTVAIATTPGPDGGLSVGGIVGIVLGVLIAIAAVIIVIIYFIRKRKTDNRNKWQQNIEISAPTPIERDNTNGNTPDNIYDNNESINKEMADSVPKLPTKKTKRTPADVETTPDKMTNNKTDAKSENSTPKMPNKMTVGNKNEPEKAKTSANVKNHTYGNVGDSSTSPNATSNVSLPEQQNSIKPNDDTYYLDMTVGKGNNDDNNDDDDACSLSNASIPELKTTIPANDTETVYVDMSSDDSSIDEEPVRIPKPEKSKVAAQVKPDGKASKMQSAKMGADSAQNEEVYENYGGQMSSETTSLCAEENLENQNRENVKQKKPRSQTGKDEHKDKGPIQEEIYENVAMSDSERSSLCEEKPGMDKKRQAVDDKSAKSKDHKPKASKTSNQPIIKEWPVEEEQIYVSTPDSPADESPMLPTESDNGTYQPLQKQGEENQYYGNVVFMPKDVIREAANVANNHKHHQDTDKLLVDARNQVAKLSKKQSKSGNISSS